MHEVSLVRSLLRQVREIADSQEGRVTVVEVRVSIGPLSGVEPLLVRSAFERLAESEGLGQASLVMDECPLRGRCRDCGAAVEIEAFNFRCPLCQSAAIQITEGDTFRIIDLTVREAA